MSVGAPVRPQRSVDPFPLFEDYRGWDLLGAGPGLPLAPGLSLNGIVTSEDGPASVFALRLDF
ncbi:MAG: hypothetical protein R3F62_21400 [Planctomycetota bacterium]